MKFNKFFAFSIIGAATVFGFSSCSDDDEPAGGNGGNGDNGNGGAASIESVFPAGVPAEYDGARIVTNEKGQVTSVISSDEILEFDYTPVSRAAKFDVVMKYYYVDEYNGEKELEAEFYSICSSTIKAS